jgi:hypothetical protein
MRFIFAGLALLLWGIGIMPEEATAQQDLSARSCINVGPSGKHNESRYDNTCPYAVEIQIARYCNGKLYAANTVRTIPANGYTLSPIYFSNCDPAGGNQSGAPLVGARRVN